MTKMNPVVHFEMPSKDNKRVSDFYSNVFGWKMNQMGADMGNYLLAQTTETDENMMVKTPGAINGGFFKYQAPTRFYIPHLVIFVDNFEKIIEIVEKTGGKIFCGSKSSGKNYEITGVWRYNFFLDFKSK